tara:strand:+ start:3328 stop:3837 length:510 start_codon:yes stop_codon:yes gene_type:complete
MINIRMNDMSDIQQQLLDQATELVRTLTGALSSGGDLSSDMESKIDEKVDEKVEEVIDEKVNEAISNSHEVPDEYKVKEWAAEEFTESDWCSVISDNDIATETWVDEKVDELVDDKLFTFMQDIMKKVFDSENNLWIERIKREGVHEHLELKKKEEEQATEQVNQEVTV